MKNYNLASRFFHYAAIADVYDALVSKRIYKPAFSHEKALEIMHSEIGTHFDPILMDCFIAIQDEFLSIVNTYKDD